MEGLDKYELVVGLEIHVQLQTDSKLFCGDATRFGAPPNTQVSAISLGHPGTLPRINGRAVEYAVRMGLACGCTIARDNYFARKNYFYPDLPKGYQISQHTTPICQGGELWIRTGDTERAVRLNRIHLEEDAGKSVHDAHPDYTGVDYNRAGTALIEMVSEPDLHDPEEVYAYVAEVRKLVRYLGISDGNMEEGSLRCDANISLRPRGATRLGTRVEVKNLNSLRYVKKAVEAEALRQAVLLDAGEKVQQQTRGFDVSTGTTFPLRDKEDADDYRYFPEPDLAPLHIAEDWLEQIRRSIPALPKERILRYTTDWQLPEYDARVLTEEREWADYFEQTTLHTKLYKPVANWLLGPVRNWCNETGQSLAAFPLKPEALARLVELTESGQVHFSMASTRLLTALLAEPEADPQALAARLQLLQVSDTGQLEPLVAAVLEELAGKVAEYRKGKKGLLALFVGEVMKRSKGKADPRLVNQLVIEKLNS